MNLMKFFGFDGEDDDYDEGEEYTQEERRKPSRSRREGSQQRSGNPSGGSSANNGKLILFNGIASDNEKRKLREAFNNGAMILIDLHDMTQIQYEQAGGKDFITFMGGVAFARNGTLIPVSNTQYLVTPRADMFEVWPIIEENEDE
ncbi:MAG: cell division protein SepF [Synergistaceae bacterium]|nr:cell division protein SepF [Synergistaceae bacterium]